MSNRIAMRSGFGVEAELPSLRADALIDIRAVAMTVSGLIRGLAGSLRCVRERRQLASFDDWMLRDIGLMRSDVERP